MADDGDGHEEAEGSVWWLLALCICMFLGSFLAGSVPLAIHLPEEKLRLVSTFGAGILIGTALIIILPEGVESIYHGGDEAGHSLIGPSITLGFLAMLLVEQLAPGSGHAPRTTTSVMSAHVEQEFRFTPSFVGILVHAAADGIAFGGASAGGNAQLEMIIFFAIMIHKAPAAFGMTSFNLSQGYSRAAVRKQLLIFACVAPTFALLTYSLVTNIHVQTPQHIWTGTVLLFSAGSFLYVATVHVLPEVISHSQPSSDASTGHSHAHGHKLPLIQLATLVCGMLAPIVLSVHHSH